MERISSLSLELVYCYARKDRALRDELDIHLAGLRRSGLITTWYDGVISPGTAWEQEIKIHLDAAHIILLLISPDFLASDYCYSREMTQAIDRHRRKEAYIIPVLLRPVDWMGTPFSALQMLPSNAQPVTRWTNQDDALEDVAKGIRQVVNKLLPQHLTIPSLDTPKLFTSEELLPQLPDQKQGRSKPVEIETSQQQKQSQIKLLSSSPLDHFPYRRNPLFTGRDAVLQKLALSLETRKIVALNGLGGIGKTQIAIEYAYRYQHDYDYILWMKANSPEDWKISIFAIANRFALYTVSENPKQDELIVMQSVKRWLQNHQRWLLIVDNGEDLSCLEDLLPTHLKGHVLFTTQSHTVGTLAQHILIEKMETEQGALFLLRRARMIDFQDSLDQVAETNRIEAGEISQLVDGLPLALDQAGAYIEETQCGLGAYKQLYQTQQDYLLKQRGTSKNDHPDSVKTTVAMALKKIEQRSQTAADLLRLCAFFASAAIPEVFITEGSSTLPLSLKQVVTNPVELNEAVKVLLTYSLIQRNRDHTFVVHGIVQAVIRYDISYKAQGTWLKYVIHIICNTLRNVENASWQQCQLYIPHLLACASMINKRNCRSFEAVTLLTFAGEYLTQSNQYEQAEWVYQQALEIDKHLKLSIRSKTAFILHKLGHLYQDIGNSQQAELYYSQGLEWYEQDSVSQPNSMINDLHCLARFYRNTSRYNQAEQTYVRALELCKLLLGPEHPLAISNLQSFAELYQEQGQYNQAEQLLQRSLDLRERIQGLEHPDTAETLHRLAHLYQEQGRYDQAETTHLRELMIREQTLGNEHPQTAESLHCLARLYIEQGNYEQAELAYKRALIIRENSLGVEHPDTIKTLHDLGLLYRKQCKYDQAEQYYQRSLSLYESVLGPEHPKTANALNNQAFFYEGQGKYELAKQFCQRALAICKLNQGIEHPKTATCIHNLAAIYVKQGKYGQAEPLYLQALTIREQSLGSEHPDTAEILHKLAHLYQEQGKYEQAEAMHLREVAILERTFGLEHPDTARSLHCLAHLYEGQGKYDQAEATHLRELAMREHMLGPEHPDTIKSLHCLAQIYREQKKYDEAEQYYERALKLRTRILGPEHPDTATTIHDLAYLFALQKKYKQAEQYYRRSLDIRIRILGSEHPDTALALQNQANFYMRQLKYKRAEQLYRQSLTIREKVLGLEHPTTTENLYGLAYLYQQQGKYEQAESLYQRVLSICEQHLGAEHPSTAYALHGLAVLYQRQEKYEQAEGLYRRALAILEQRLGPTHPETLLTRNDYAAFLRLVGRDVEATVLDEQSAEGGH